MKPLDQPIGNGFSSLLLCLTVALAPLPFGSTDAWTTSVWCITLGLALTQVQPAQLRSAHWRLLGLVGLLALAYAFVISEQLVGNSWLSISVPNPLWRESSALLKTPLPAALTVAHNQPWLALGPTLSMALALICAFLVGLDRDRARMLMRAVAWSGTAYAGLGIVQHIFDPTQVLWRDKQAYIDSLTGPFINRNTAAVYFGVCAILWLLFLFEKIETLLPSRNDAASLWRLLLTRSNEIQLPALMFMLCLAAMLLTGSRAGVVISLVAMVAASPLFFSRRLSRTSAVGIALAAGVGVALVLFETIGAGVNARFELDQLATGGRWEAYRSTLEIIADYPWLGTGLGTFAWIFPAYRSGTISIRGVWDRAHDTALELTSEMGIPLALMVAAGWVVIVAVLCSGIRKRRRDRIFPIAGCLAASVALLHSLIDFSLQIPGFALVIAALTGTGLAQSFQTGKRASERVGQGARHKAKGTDCRP